MFVAAPCLALDFALGQIYSPNFRRQRLLTLARGRVLNNLLYTDKNVFFLICGQQNFRKNFDQDYSFSVQVFNFVPFYIFWPKFSISGIIFGFIFYFWTNVLFLTNFSIFD